MPKIHLTDIVVQRLKEPGLYFDQSLSNFGIRIGKHRKTWDVADVAKARTWLASDETKVAMEKSGVVGPPNVRFAAAA